jgi:hypothetical protein
VRSGTVPAARFGVEATLERGLATARSGPATGWRVIHRARPLARASWRNDPPHDADRHPPQGAAGKPLCEQAVEADADHLGGEEHEQLEPNAGEASPVHEKPLGPGGAEELPLQPGDEARQDAPVAALLADEELERSAVVDVDAGQLGRIDLVRDAPLAGFADLEARQGARERSAKPDRSLPPIHALDAHHPDPKPRLFTLCV